MKYMMILVVVLFVGCVDVTGTVPKSSNWVTKKRPVTVDVAVEYKISREDDRVNK